MILPFQTWVETLSIFPAPGFFSILRWLKLKRSNAQGPGWAGIFQVSHAVHMQPWLTFWNYTGIGSISKPQPELWNTSREPCLLFLHSPWTKLVKICLLTVVILDYLRASKILSLPYRNLFILSQPCLSSASPGCHRISWIVGIPAASAPVLRTPCLFPALLSGGLCTHASTGSFYPRKSTRAGIWCYHSLLALH